MDPIEQMFRRCDRKLALALIAAGMSSPYASAATQGVETDQNPGQPVAVAAGATDLYLEVSINGAAMQQIGHFTILPDGRLAASADELRQIGIKPPGGTTGADGLIIIDDIGSIHYVIDHPAQKINFSVGDHGREPERIDAADRNDTAPGQTQSAFGAVVDYTLFAATNSLVKGQDGFFQGVSGLFDARLFGRYGLLRSSFISNYNADGRADYRRLATSWSLSDPSTMTSYRMGDLISGGLSWTRPVYLGGVQIARNFALRPDLVTQPMPSFSGSASVPSTLEVFIDNARSYSGPLRSGPFQLVNIPAFTGQGQARIVVTDSLGRQTSTSLPFYASNMLLKRGLFDYSAEIGAPRRNFGLPNDAYDRQIFGSFSARYGLADWLTLEGHLEGGIDLFNGGAGLAFPLAGYGAASLALSGSQSQAGTGGQINAAMELGYRGWTLYGRLQHSFGNYQDIASISAITPKNPGHGAMKSAAPLRTMQQISLGMPMPLDFSQLNLAYTGFSYQDQPTARIGSISYSQSLFKGGSFYLTAFRDFAVRDRYGVFAGLTVSFDNGITSTSGVETGPDGLYGFTELNRSAERRDGSYGWRIRASQGGTPQRTASAYYRSSLARSEASLQQSGEHLRASAQIEGSIVAAGGDVFLSNRIDDAFAIVNVGVADVDVLYENRSVGKTNRRGRALLPDLRSYQNNSIAIDPRNLPVDAAVPKTSEIVVPPAGSGIMVDFGLTGHSAAALLSFVDSNGQPLPVSSTGIVAASGEQFVIGYEGQAYILKLAAHNEVLINLGDGNSCRAEFPYRPRPGSQVVIERLTCQ